MFATTFDSPGRWQLQDQRAVDFKVLSIGDLIEDIIVVSKKNPEVDTDNIARIYGRLGGAATNFAVWAAALGLDSHLLARVGKGEAVKYTRYLAKRNVTAHLQEDKDLETGRIVAISSEDGRTFYTDRGANLNLETHIIPSDAYGAALFISGYTVLSIGSEGTKKLIPRMQEQGMVVFVDPGSEGFIEDYGVKYFMDAIEGADAILPNLAEAQLITGEQDPHKAASELHRKFGIVAITMGADGAIVQNAAGQTHITAPKVRVKDTTGAGDAFNAMFIRRMLEHAPIAEAGYEAVHFASQATEVVGAQPGEYDLPELDSSKLFPSYKDELPPIDDLEPLWGAPIGSVYDTDPYENPDGTPYDPNWVDPNSEEGKAKKAEEELAKPIPIGTAKGKRKNNPPKKK